ncbi:hypothetical protein [Paenibacillus sp. YYML68]|uniref:hypothetical protein n=1 Tax=Paenibacillus sp. YYML68 TaxID=2909250 RepID=UPI002493058C|nr:hypothetical protein [Paenibacillus sp. YYML68]
MSSKPIFFQFATDKDAYMALDTLEELGYSVSMHTEAKQPVLQVVVDRHDLTSCLEVSQSHGGCLLETHQGERESDVYALAYHTEDGMIPIPAHLVNEDLADSEPVTSASAYMNRSSGAYNDDHSEFDPSGDSYDGFDAGIHL